MTAPEQQLSPGAGLRLSPAAYTTAQAAITVHMVRAVVRLMRLLGIPLTAPDRQRFAQRLFPELQAARGASYQLAVGLMNYSAHAAGEPLPPVAPIAPYDVDAVVKVLERSTAPVQRAIAQAATKPAAPAPLSIIDRRTGLPIDNLGNPDSPRVVVRIAENTGAAAARHAHQAGREAIIATANNASDEIGWARVTTTAHPCVFCSMLASRGPVYHSDKTADFRAHDHCSCTAVLVYYGKPWDGHADYRRLSDLWASSTAHKSGKAAVKAFGAALATEQ